MKMSTLVDKPLQNLCIKSILWHFDVFFTAYESANSPILRKHFEFLQRKYCNLLLEKLSKEYRLKDEYVGFFINKHVKELDFNQFRNCNWDVVEKRFLDVGGDSIVKLQVISEMQKPLSPVSLRNIVQHFKNLDTLILAYTRCSDDTLKAIGETCPLLKSLDVYSCRSVTDQGLKNLCASNSCALQVLDVNHSNVRDDGIAFILKHMPSLEVLKYERISIVLYEMHKKDLEENSLDKANKYNLTFFDCRFRSNDVFLVCSVLCPRLQNLNYRFVRNEMELSLCCNFDQLQSVRLRGISKISINSFLKARGNKLNSLGLEVFSVSVSVLTHSCPRLKSLCLGSITFQNTGAWDVSPLNSLVFFSVYGAVFFDETTARSVASILLASPNLEEVILWDCRLFCAEINNAILECSRRLKKLDFSESEVQFPLLETILLTSSTLKSLNITYCEHITAAKYHALLELVKVRKSGVHIIWESASTDDEMVLDHDFSDDFDDFDDDEVRLYYNSDS